MLMYIPFKISDYYIRLQIRETITGSSNSTGSSKYSEEVSGSTNFHVKKNNKIVAQSTHRHYTVEYIHIYYGNGEEESYHPLQETFTHKEIVTILLSQQVHPKYIITDDMASSSILQYLILTYTNREMWKTQQKKLIVWTFMHLHPDEVVHLFRQSIVHNGREKQFFVSPPDIKFKRRHVYIPPTAVITVIQPIIRIFVSYPIPKDMGQCVTSLFNDTIAKIKKEVI